MFKLSEGISFYSIVGTMSEGFKRLDGRRCNQVRPINVTYNVFEYAAGSVLYEIGKTKVLCAITLQEGVPPFLRGKKTGWLSAEYSLMPTSTRTRVAREAVAGKRNGRTVEISRLISRVLRPVLQLDVLGERTIIVDCDVLQADGGTRTASITGACLAIKAAEQKWLAEGIITSPLLLDEVAALSVGVVKGNALLDVDFIEDSEGEADFNIVMTKSGRLLEIQGTAEKASISWENFEHIRQLSIEGIADLFKIIQTISVHDGTTISSSRIDEQVSL